ncbi:30S ribosome-binding factor RbfA [Natranaerofaba carboxydovora]|uniref:30S ribosome-binding factor RbfA n=1 Tax=Natranaerofaba carboxydovora TaxID=2742683 RepID=UPI001F133C01|nr:30S ribosome-binding factor RbfA [Natranaerofaba carboxydovora]UMZ73411.1 Ribosome-binding factor A [Natranaerofaba carboxydovora]
MDSSRKNRMQEEVKKTVSEIVQKEAKDPDIGFVTITNVDLSGDLRHAKVYVSVYGDEEQRQKTLDALERATGFVRSELGNRMRFKHVPELIFKFDASIEHGDNINKILRELDLGKDDRETDEEADKDE